MASQATGGGLTTTVTKSDGVSPLDAAMFCDVQTDGSDIVVTLRNDHPTDSLDMVAIKVDIGWTGAAQPTGFWHGKPGFKRKVTTYWEFPNGPQPGFLFGGGYQDPGICFPILGCDDGNKALCVSCNIQSYCWWFPVVSGGGAKQLIIQGNLKQYAGNGPTDQARWISPTDYLQPGETRVIKIWIRRSTPGAQPTPAQMVALAQPWIDWYQATFPIARPPRVSGRIWALGVAQGEYSQDQVPPNPRQYIDYMPGQFITAPNTGAGKRVDKDPIDVVLDAALGQSIGAIDTLLAKGFKQVLIWALSGLNRVWDYDPAFWNNRPAICLEADLRSWSHRRGLKFGFWCGSTSRRVTGGYGAGNVYAATPDDISYEGDVFPGDQVLSLPTRRHPKWDPLHEAFLRANPIAAFTAGASLMGLDAAATPISFGPWVYDMHLFLRRNTAGMPMVTESYGTIYGQHLMGAYYFPIADQWDNIRCPIKQILFGVGYQDWCQINYWADGYYDAGGIHDAAFVAKVVEVEATGTALTIAAPLNVIEMLPAFAGQVYNDVDPLLAQKKDTDPKVKLRHRRAVLQRIAMNIIDGQETDADISS